MAGEMTMKERVARVLCRQHELLEHGKDSDAAWSGWMEPARAVIQEMRVPTMGMLNAACDIGIAPDPMNTSVTYANGSEATEIWHSMIDAALSEGSVR